MDEQRVRQIVREELAKAVSVRDVLAEAVPVIQDRIRSCLASDLARPNKLRRQRGDLERPPPRGGGEGGTGGAGTGF